MGGLGDGEEFFVRACVLACAHGSDLQTADCSHKNSSEGGLDEDWGW